VPSTHHDAQDAQDAHDATQHDQHGAPRVRFADPLLVAYHFEAAAFVLPYTTHFDAESWWYSAVVANALQSLHFRGHVFQFNTVYVHDNQKSLGYSGFRQVASSLCLRPPRLALLCPGV
jgi:hypothetical protein